jgi:TPR repeat protein
MVQMRQYKLNQVCPLCRTPLSPGPEKLYADATIRFMVILQRVFIGNASWGALTEGEQLEMDEVQRGWLAAADQGYVHAQSNLGIMYEHGRGVAQFALAS